jgi:signal transduction histidine kinase
MKAKTLKKKAERRLTTKPDAQPQSNEYTDSTSRLLKERIKELEFMHSINEFIENNKTSLEEILRRIVLSIPSALQFPDRACCRIELQGKTFSTLKNKRPYYAHKVDIRVHGESSGFLEVRYIDLALPKDTKPFLPEEIRLLQSISARLTDICEIKSSEGKIRSYQEELRSLVFQRQLIEEKERHRIAILLHDSIGQSMAVAKLRLEALMFADLPESEKRKIQDITDLLRQTILDARSLMFDLSPPILFETGLGPALGWLARQIKNRFGLDVQVTLNSSCDVVVPEDISILLYRAANELLTNVVKHARATRVSVVLSLRERDLQIAVEDDGTGFDLANVDRRYVDFTGFGLFSIREEMTHCGGTFKVESVKPHGTRIIMGLPLKMANN